MSHEHEHSHSHSGNKKVLRVSFIVIAVFMVVEIVGGLLTNSLALLSDAGHMFSDAAALGLSLLAFHFGERPGSRSNTFGYKRFEILAALLNGLTLMLIAVWIVYEAVGRFANPPEIATTGMLVVSVIGLLVNIFVAWYMHRGGDTERDRAQKVVDGHDADRRHQAGQHHPPQAAALRAGEQHHDRQLRRLGLRPTFLQLIQRLLLHGIVYRLFR